MGAKDRVVLRNPDIYIFRKVEVAKPPDSELVAISIVLWAMLKRALVQRFLRFPLL